MWMNLVGRVDRNFTYMMSTVSCRWVGAVVSNGRVQIFVGRCRWVRMFPRECK